MPSRYVSRLILPICHTTFFPSLHIADIFFAQLERLVGVGAMQRSESCPSEDEASANAACEQRRRQLQFLSIPASTSRDDASADEMPHDEVAWHEVWRQRLGCWWLALPGPTRAELSNCLGALSLHLGSRLDRMLGRPPVDPPVHAAVQSGCQLVAPESERLQLPPFPSLDGVDFTLPPLPRLLPSIERAHLLSHSHVQDAHARWLGSSEGISSAISTAISWTPLTRGFGSGTAVFALTAIVFCMGAPRPRDRDGRASLKLALRRHWQSERHY